MRIEKVFFLILITLLSAGCKKNQPGGKSILTGQVKHHEKVIPFSTVFIKYAAEEFPGADTLLYDSKVKTGADGRYSFSMYQGTYFLYGRGYDSGVPGTVVGGIKYHLRNNETKSLDVSVTEE